MKWKGGSTFEALKMTMYGNKPKLLITFSFLEKKVSKLFSIPNYLFYIYTIIINKTEKWKFQLFMVNSPK